MWQFDQEKKVSVSWAEKQSLGQSTGQNLIFRWLTLNSELICKTREFYIIQDFIGAQKRFTVTTDFLATSSHLVYSGRREAWSLISMSFTCVRMANFQLSRTWVRLEQLLPLVGSAGHKESAFQNKFKTCFLYLPSAENASFQTFWIPGGHFLFPFLSSTDWDHAEKRQKLRHLHFLMNKNTQKRNIHEYFWLKKIKNDKSN